MSSFNQYDGTILWCFRYVEKGVSIKMLDSENPGWECEQANFDSGGMLFEKSVSTSLTAKTGRAHVGSSEAELSIMRMDKY